MNNTLKYRTFLYLLTPNETGIYQYGKDLKVLQLERNGTADIASFLWLFEAFLLLFWYKNSTNYGLADSIAGLVQGTLLKSTSIIGYLDFYSLSALYLPFYSYLYENYRLLDLESSGFFQTWPGFIYAALIMELMYYIQHRLSHEINLLWAVHQIHHSGQNFNLSVALRNSVYETIFYVHHLITPFLGISPQQYIIHKAANYFFQFWIHTNAINKCHWIIEYIFMTPSHHRVHHGRNKDCIDKNYGGLLIIYDRMFGTFTEETGYERVRSRDDENGEVIPGKDEQLAYGLVSNVDTFSVFYLHNHYFKYIFGNAYENFKKFGPIKALQTLFYGPGYNLPGNKKSKNRLGNLKDIPQIESPINYYTPKSNKNFKILFYSLSIVGLISIQIDGIHKLLAVQEQNLTIMHKLVICGVHGLMLEMVTKYLDDKRPSIFMTVGLHFLSSACWLYFLDVSGGIVVANLFLMVFSFVI